VTTQVNFELEVWRVGRIPLLFSPIFLWVLVVFYGGFFSNDPLTVNSLPLYRRNRPQGGLNLLM